MKLVRKARLYFQEGKSDKVYEVDLCDLGSGSGSGRYVVNFRYGRRGASLKESTKTVRPVALNEANEIFDSVVVSKTNKGYKVSELTSPTGRTESSQPQSQPDSNSAAGQHSRERIILERIAAFRQKAISASEVKRSVWRAGELELRAAASQMIALIGNDDSLLDYCIAWALGRCGDSSVIPSLNELHRKYGLNYVGRMSREAVLALSESADRAPIYQSIKQDLPHSLVEAIDSNDSARIVSALEMMLQSSEPRHSAIISDLYTLARDDAILLDALCTVIANIELKPDTFKGIRQIYKTAEFRRDEKMFGLVTYKIDNSPAFYNRPLYSTHAFSPKTNRYTDIRKEIAKEDSAFAFSNHTRNYFRRRSWRSLKRLGELGSGYYAEMATGVLLAVSDEDARPDHRFEYYDYNLRKVVRILYDQYSRFMAFNFILNRNNPRIKQSPNKKHWIVHEDVAEVAAFRSEAFPALWDKQPQQLLKLLLQSRCTEVHKFAVRAIRGNKEFVVSLDIATIVILLQKPYEVTAKLGLELAKASISAGKVNAILLKALVNGFTEPARQLARDVLSANPGWFIDDAELLFVVLVSEYADNRLWMRRFATELVLEDQQVHSLIARLIAHVMELGADESRHRAVIDDIGWMLINVYIQQVRQLGFDVVGDLLNHTAESVQMLAARILINHATDAQKLPPAMLRKLMEAGSAEVRALGVQLFGQLPDDILLQQPELVVALAVSRDALVRQAARPIVSRLSQRDVEFARSALQKFMGYLFLAERSEGFHDDILNLVQSDLNHVAQELDVNTTWRLLQSRSKAAKRFGAHLVSRFTHDDFSVRQLARLGGHAILSVRQWAWLGFNTNIDRVKKEAQDALIILDNHWDDGRAFAFDFFHKQFTASDWNPDLLVSICDSVRNDVQNFGRDLINRFFEETDGVTYLLKLSQHPSPNVQLFASNYLKQYAAGNIDHLKKLRHYFVTVLSQVNRGRAAKSRITRFLGEEGLKSEAAASLVADIFSRQSVTSAMVDKSACIDILVKIRSRYPGIESPLRIVPTADYNAQPQGVA